METSSKRLTAGLRVSTSSGAKWLTSSQLVRQLMQLATTGILLQVLAPEDFGLLGMALIVVTFVTIFRDMGTSAAIVQRADASNIFLVSIFWANVAIGVVLAIFVYAFAPIYAAFYQEEAVRLIVQALSITFLANSLGVVHRAILEKELKFRTVAIIEVTGTLISAIVGISLAYTGFGVWSLVIQTILAAVASTILLWFVGHWAPHFAFSWQEVKGASTFSLNVVGYSFLNYLSRNVDYILIGRFLGAASLGYYTLAYQIMLYPLFSISKIINRVVFPAFSKLQNNDELLRQGYLAVNGLIAFVTFPLMLFLMAVSDLLLLALAHEWVYVSELLTILAPVGMVQSVLSTVGTIYLAKGRTDILIKWSVFALLVFTTGFVVGLNWGIEGVAMSYAIATAILIYPGFKIPFNLIDLTVLALWHRVARTLLASLIMVVSILGIRFYLVAAYSSYAQVIILTTVATIIYLLASYFVNRFRLMEFASLLHLEPMLK